ncbi:MAG: DUF167 domain-containing protein [Acidimicrobiales bacterium]
MSPRKRPAEPRPVRLQIHVRPGSSATAVGGTHDGALVVRVVEPADAGRATAAALAAIARAVGLPRSAVTLVQGATSRRKVVDIDAGAARAGDVAASLERLRGAGG